MSPTTFIHKGDLVNEINRLGALYDIKDEFVDSPQIFMLCCSNKLERCEAKIIGIFSQKDKMFHIKRLVSVHTCSKNNKRDIALYNEIQKYPNVTRIGELVEKISQNFKTSYFDVFKVQNLGGCNIEIFDKENQRNNSGFFLNELEYANKDTLTLQKSEDCKTEAMNQLKNEFIMLNPEMSCQATKNSFFFKHNQMSKHLRKISEIKIYQRPTGTVILGLLFDPTDDYIIQSVLVSEEPKVKALEEFLARDKEASSADCHQFFIVDNDFEVIEVLKEKKIPFFIKTRSLCSYLLESKEEDPMTMGIFLELNYGDTEIFDLDKKHYLKKHCPYKLYNLNNAHTPDFDFMTSSILSLSLIDLSIAMIWLVSDDIKNRKNFGFDELDMKFSDQLLAFIDDLAESTPSSGFEVDLTSFTCTCGKFQEYLIPCQHAYHKIKELGKDPLLYISSVYSKENYLLIQDLIPIVNIKIHPNKFRPQCKKKKGDHDDSDDL